MRKALLAVAILSLILTVGCAKGGDGTGDGVSVMVDDNGISVAGVNLVITFTAKVTGSTNPNVTWTISGASCSGNPNPCGSFTATTGTTATYQAPATVPSNPAVTIKAVAQADNIASDSATLTIVNLTTTVAPTPVTVGQGLVQQFTAVALPDNAPQNFTWTCTANGAPCANFVSNNSGLAVYTAQDAACNNGCVLISAVPTGDPNSCGLAAKNCPPAKVSVVPARLTGTYAFRFSGYDSSNKAVAVAGIFTVTGGAISGLEDELTSAGPAQHPISGGSYTPSTDPNNSNNAGTLRLTTGSFPNQFLVVLDSTGDVQMIESDGHGNGSGVAEKSATSQFNTSAQTFAFGFTGVDSAGNRAGAAGLAPLDGTANIAGGLMDVNDNGNNTNVCGAAPCNLAGSYLFDKNTGLGQMTLTSAVTMHFDFFVANGQTKSAANPLTLYAISTDPVDAQHPAFSGALVYQDPSQTYNNAAFNGNSVSALTGANANVSLTVATTDGSSSGSGGTGGFSGIFDQNDNGVITSIDPMKEFVYTYVSTNGNTGRYTFQMLGDPNAKTVIPPIPFTLYASGANRGFLLDQSSASVMTGTMTPQANKIYAPTGLPGTYALATNSNSASSIEAIASNLVLTSSGNATYVVGGKQNPGNLTLTGTYYVDFTGVGPITLTTPAPAKYVFYMIDLTDFYVIGEDAGVPSAVMFTQE